MLVARSRLTPLAFAGRVARRLAALTTVAILLFGPAPLVGAEPNRAAGVEMPTGGAPLPPTEGATKSAEGEPPTETPARRQRGVQGEAAVSEEQPLRAWHFAEGNSRHEFQTFFSVLNLSDRPASVTANYHREDGIRMVQWLGVEPRSRVSLDVGEIVGQHAFGASFAADEDVVVERSTTWGPDQHAETTLGFAPNGKRAWHFAEGTTRGRVTTFFVTQNLSDVPATVRATFTRDDGSREQRSVTLPPRGREAFRMNDLLRNTAFAASFTADQDVVVERTILNEGPVGVLGGFGYAPTGPEAGARAWDFAEGSTRQPYATYFIVFNPNPEPTDVRLLFRLDGGVTRKHRLSLPPFGRLAIDPREIVPAADFATSIVADRPIVAERSYSSSGDGLFGALGYTPTADRRNSRTWYFADGNTGGQTETFFVLANLSDRSAEVRASFFADDGKSRDHAMTIPAGGRLSIRANDLVSERAFASRFLADRDIAVERTVYFGGRGGFTSFGAGAGRP
ncbi:MAG: hypothetical protein H0V51_19940 [Chloroflexi bacterium]|nr:hypothetical protein [Chloroflexota bacterium]